MKILVATSIYPSAKDPSKGTFVRTQVEYLKRAGVMVELLILQERAKRLKYLKAALELRRRLADGSIDLVHAHYSYVGIMARTQWKVPVVVSYCGDDILGTINTKGKPTAFSRLAVFAGRMLGNHADGVIVKSKEMASKFKRRDVYIIPHEIDLEVFRPLETANARAVLDLDPCKKYLLFAANPYIPVKRFPLARAIANQLKALDPSVELLVVYKEPQFRLSLYMSACDALVFTSYQEGSPNVVKQAMACNLPIVSTDVGDVREVIGTTEGCYLCNPSVNEFVGALTKVLQVRLRTQGRQHVDHLSGPLVALKLIRTYEETLAKCGTRSSRLASVPTP